jgi:spore germination protein YaaH
MTYQAGDVSHEVWIPDAQTVEALMEVGRDLGVAGYGIWRLGGEDPAAWPAVARAAPG